MRKPRCPWIHDHKPWTPSEEAFLREHRGAMSAAAMAAAMPGRTENAVQSRCTQLKIYRRDMRPTTLPPPIRRNYWWTGPEIKVLRANAHLQPHQIQRWYLPHRTIHAIANKITVLGIRPFEFRKLPVTKIPNLQVAA